MKTKLLFLGILFLFISCEPIVKEAPWFKVEGNVLYQDGTPVFKAMVGMSPYGMCVTDEKGHFGFKGEIYTGTEYKISVLLLSYLMHEERISVEAGKTTSLLIKIPSLDFPELNIVDVSEESDWEIWGGGKEEYFFLNTTNSLPDSAFYYSFKQKKDYSIYFNKEGLPKKIISDEGILLLDNFNGKKVDLAFITSSGDIQIAREIESDFNWDDLDSKGSTVNAVKWFGRTMGAVSCAASVATAVSTGGITAPLALWNCGNYFLKLAAGIAEDHEVFQGFTEAVKYYSLATTAYNCSGGDPSSCLISIAQGLLMKWAENRDALEEREDEVRLAEASLYAGHGDIQVTLTWDNTADLDLHVIDPFGEEIYWKHKTSASGGYLDYDDINGYGPENIYWENSSAPSGIYKVFVHHYPWSTKPSSSNYAILITAFGKTKRFEGAITYNKTIHITDFNQSGFISVKSSDEISITISDSKAK